MSVFHLHVAPPAKSLKHCKYRGCKSAEFAIDIFFH